EGDRGIAPGNLELAGMQIKIRQTLTLEYIEKLYVELYSNVPDVVVDIMVPLRITDKGVGVIPAFFQFIATWLRARKGKLIVPVREGTEDGKKFACSSFGYYTLLMAWKAVPIVNEKQKDIKLEFREFTKLM